MEEVMMRTLFRVGFLASLCLAFMAAITFPLSLSKASLQRKGIASMSKRHM